MPPAQARSSPIRDKAVCALCGEKMARDTKSHGRPCWRCKNPECGCSIYLDDSIILELVIQKLKELAKSPSASNYPKLPQLQRMPSALRMNWLSALTGQISMQNI